MRAAELVDESEVWDRCAPPGVFLCAPILLDMLRGSPRSVALGSWCGYVSDGPAAKGRKAGSSSSSASPDSPSLDVYLAAGRRRRRLCTGGPEEEEEESEVLSSGEGEGSGGGDRAGTSTSEAGLALGFGDRGLRFSVA